MLHVGKVTLNVSDQDAAKQFWTEKMGFEEVMDAPMGEAGSPRWIEVRAPGDGITLVLFSTHFDMEKVGALNNVLFTCADIRATYEELLAKGIEFPDKPAAQEWGWWATFRDNEGNFYGLTQNGR
ncbi:VOC family protein [Streptomyces sp. SID3343]|uniref:VOC family protein n=1 Tax=Streptomyces sp. SID3343 TaxID=2690260 RepID=UPI00136AD643|nr:VOC family protein [Streptomyces sp. SID3343]MYV97976.1 glyoxalase [Streptomyces sp. SID3343]